MPQCDPVCLAKNRSLFPARPGRAVFLGAGGRDVEFVYDSRIDDPRPTDQRVVVGEIVIVKREGEVRITEDSSPALGIGLPLLQAYRNRVLQVRHNVEFERVRSLGSVLNILELVVVESPRQTAVGDIGQREHAEQFLAIGVDPVRRYFIV